MPKLPAYEFRPIRPEDGVNDELVADLFAAGFKPLTFAPVEEMPQADQDFFTVRNFLEFCIRLTGENLIVNPAVAAHFASLRIPSHLYSTSEFPYHGIVELSFNSFARQVNVDRA